MALQDPVAVYNAATNIEAQLVRIFLVDAGIEAFAVEDVSQVGTWAFGLLPEIHKPQVWVDRENVEQAHSFIVEYERRSRADESEPRNDRFCYECGESVEQNVSLCPSCGQALDWSEDTEDAT
ncbi:MAG: zinc ribbon domain-containing protein [Gemmataceae bacterium]|nr:zinc ribbon domain-containing protein [Gemmataceae bacterium]